MYVYVYVYVYVYCTCMCMGSFPTRGALYLLLLHHLQLHRRGRLSYLLHHHLLLNHHDAPAGGGIMAQLVCAHAGADAAAVRRRGSEVCQKSPT